MLKIIIKISPPHSPPQVLTGIFDFATRAGVVLSARQCQQPLVHECMSFLIHLRIPPLAVYERPLPALGSIILNNTIHLTVLFISPKKLIHSCTIFLMSKITLKLQVMHQLMHLTDAYKSGLVFSLARCEAAFFFPTCHLQAFRHTTLILLVNLLGVGRLIIWGRLRKT